MNERTLNELERLAKLKEKGVLSDEELAEHKKALLEGPHIRPGDKKSGKGKSKDVKVLLALILLCFIGVAGYYFGYQLPQQEAAAQADRQKELEIQEEQLEIQKQEWRCSPDNHSRRSTRGC